MSHSFFASKSDFAACSPDPPARSANSSCPLASFLPCRSVSSVVNSSIVSPGFAIRRDQCPRAARTEALYQYDLQKPQISCINLLRSNNYRPITEHPNPKLRIPESVTLQRFSVVAPPAKAASRSRNDPDFSRPDPRPPWTKLSHFVTLVSFCSQSSTSQPAPAPNARSPTPRIDSHSHSLRSLYYKTGNSCFLGKELGCGRQAALGRVVLTHNRRHYVRLHHRGGRRTSVF